MKDNFTIKNIFCYNFINKSEQELVKLAKIFSYSLEGDAFIFGGCVYLITPCADDTAFNSQMKILMDNKLNNTSCILSKIQIINPKVNYHSLCFSLSDRDNKELILIEYPNRAKTPEKFTEIVSPKITSNGGFKLVDEDFDKMYVHYDIKIKHIIEIIAKQEYPIIKEEETMDINSILDKINANGIEALSEEERNKLEKFRKNL